MSADNLPHRDSVSEKPVITVLEFLSAIPGPQMLAKDLSTDSISDKKICTNDNSWLILINTIPET